MKAPNTELLECSDVEQDFVGSSGVATPSTLRYLESVFDLSILDYCKNIAVRNIGHRSRDIMASVDIRLILK